MAIRIVVFSNGEYKISKILSECCAQNQTKYPKLFQILTWIGQILEWIGDLLSLLLLWILAMFHIFFFSFTFFFLYLGFDMEKNLYTRYVHYFISVHFGYHIVGFVCASVLLGF